MIGKMGMGCVASGGYWCLVGNKLKKPPGRPKPVKLCLFCGSRGPLSEEHVFGEWLKKLGHGGNGIREYVDGAAPVIQVGGPFSKTLKIVCRSCNNGWMSRMEDAVKPLLIDMFNGNRVELDEAAQRDLARWAFKTAAVLAHVTGRQGQVPVEQCRAFHQTDEPPPGVFIRIGAASVSSNHHGEQVGESSFLKLPMVMTAGNKRFDIPAYSARFRLFTVVFDVFGTFVSDKVANSLGLPSGGLQTQVEVGEDMGRVLVQIWPPMNPTVWWPPVNSLDVVGGIAGLTQVNQFQSVPMLLPLPASDAAGQ
jgi:hypothetical protein